MLKCRKNQATLTATEKASFVAAVLALKANGKYDQYVQWHMTSMQVAHRGPAFFPWHREFLRRFELDLQAIDPSVTLPYWNWTVDNSPLSSIWNNDFMGGNGQPANGIVTSGPFAYSTGNWPLNIVEPFNAGPELRRRFGVSAPNLPTPAQLANALSQTPYDVAPYNLTVNSGFRNIAEGWVNGPALHNLVHVWIGGSMSPSTSPNDPVFFLNHCFVDKMWADWQAMNPGFGYLPAAGAPAGHNLMDAMEPWASLGDTVTPASLLDHHALGYAYDTEAICSPKFKWADDPITLKFSDDHFKAARDHIKIKFADDPLTLKFFDDGGKSKFTDDITLKNNDDVTTPIADIQTNPRIDPVKLPQLDKPPGSDVFQPPDRTLNEGIPFVLSTPHHSMAWTQSFPQAHQAELARLESAIREHEQAIHEINQRFEQGRLSEAEKQQAQALYTNYQALLTEYQRLAQ